MRRAEGPQPTRTRRPRPGKAEQTRARLQDAALSVFARKGVHDSRVEDFCAAAGIARATFYRHFDSKADVFGALFEAMSEELRATASGLGPVTPDAAGLATLEQWVAELLAIGDKWGPVVEVLSQPSEAAPDIRRRSVAVTAEFAARAGECFAAGPVDGVDAGMAALAVIAMTDGFGRQVRTWGLGLERRPTAHALATLTLKMLYPDLDVDRIGLAAGR